MYIYVYKCAKVISKKITQFSPYKNNINDWIYIQRVTNNSGNDNSPTSPKKEVKYHYPDEITVFTQ